MSARGSVLRLLEPGNPVTARVRTAGILIPFIILWLFTSYGIVEPFLAEWILRFP